jgi:hypothetical protein
MSGPVGPKTVVVIHETMRGSPFNCHALCVVNVVFLDSIVAALESSRSLLVLSPRE